MDMFHFAANLFTYVIIKNSELSRRIAFVQVITPLQSNDKQKSARQQQDFTGQQKVIYPILYWYNQLM